EARKDSEDVDDRPREHLRRPCVQGDAPEKRGTKPHQQAAKGAKPPGPNQPGRHRDRAIHAIRLRISQRDTIPKKMHPDPPSGRKKDDMHLAVSLERPAEAAPEAQAAESLEERMIVELCLAGEPHQFRRLVERHQRGILGLTYRMLGSRAE